MGSKRNLLEAECGQSNALVRVGRQLFQDASSERTRAFFGPLQSNIRLEDQFAQEYLAQFGDVSRRQPTTFSMHGLLEEVNRLEPAFPSASATEWSREYMDGHKLAQDWTNDYLRDKGNLLPGQDVLLDDAWRTASFEQPALKWSTEYLTDAEMGTTLTDRTNASGSSLLEGVPSDAELWNTEFMQFMQKVDRGEVKIDDEGATGARDITNDNHLAHSADSFWEKFESEWDDLAKNSESHRWLAEYDNISSLYKDYHMSEQNPYLNTDDPLSVGKRLLKDGDLANAVLCFEAAVQQQPTSSEAWFHLARGQAENEQETRAITAANKCLELDPKNLDALATLSTAYANESLNESSCRALAQWLDAHPKYHQFAPADVVNERQRPMVSSFMDQRLFDSVEGAYLDAARSDVMVDADLQNCFGVLYNLTGNTDRAVDCFQSALMIRPEDARIWNRLGATLANGGRSAEAIAAYRRALELYPGFVRARYNLGISCQNLGASREAIDHFLSALSLQMRGVGPANKNLMSDSIWGTLRVAIMQLNNDDWLKLVDNRDFNGLKNIFNISSTNSIPVPGDIHE